MEIIRKCGEATFLSYQAYDAALAGNVREAARLYQAAADTYPNRATKLAKLEIARLERYARIYLQAKLD